MTRSGDRRVWARLTVDFADSPKVAGLSDSAFRALVEMILWSRKMMTDGVIPASVARRRWGAKTQTETHSVTDSVTDSLTDSGTHYVTDPVTELCTNHPTSPSLVRTSDGGYIIHDFLDHQESAEEVNARNARNSANGRRGGRPRKTDSKTHSVTDSVTDSLTDSGTQTKPKPKAELELELEEEVLRTSSGGSGGKRNDVADAEPAPVAPTALPATTKATKRSDRATRLPDDWAPSPALIDWTRVNTPDVQDSEVDRFRDYWHSAAGAKARKVDWDAVWRNWARRAQDDANTRRSRQGYRNQAQIMADMRQQAAESTITMQRAQQGDALRLIAGGAS